MIKQLFTSREGAIAVLALAGITLHGVFYFLGAPDEVLGVVPLYLALIGGGAPLLYELIKKALRLDFGSDLLAGLSIVTAIALNQPLAGAFVVLMLSGGEALERFAAGRASSILRALAERTPQIAHRKDGESLVDIPVDDIQIGDLLVIFPQEITPVDGVVVSGHGSMDEAFLTGEPFRISKAPGAEVISGALNGEHALTIKAIRHASQSRYARIAQVLKETQHKKLQLRRLGDKLGALYTPIALLIAAAAWYLSGDPLRFLAVLVIATPCPLLIAIPVAVIGSISLAAMRGIIIRDPAVLEHASTCRTIILDKTGTLTQGVPILTEQLIVGAQSREEVLLLTASTEQYSKHPLAMAICRAAEQSGLPATQAFEIQSQPGIGLRGTVNGRELLITSRKILATLDIHGKEKLPPEQSGLECIIVIDGVLAALYRFKDAARAESHSFIRHLGPKHDFNKVMIVSGDRESEVRYLAEQVGITLIYSQKSPEEKLEIVRAEKALAPTLFIGDGINDAPALMEATVGLAFGHQSDITSEAAGAVIMDTSLEKVDEFFHISSRMRRIALQSAVGGMLASVIGMFVAAMGYLPPVAGAVCQELIDLFAVINALRVARAPGRLVDL